MDDPWGSPWAATDPQKDQKLASPAMSDLAPPPRAFLSASSSPRIPAISDQSPWGGDDTGLGEWATPSETPPVHSVWAGGWGSSSPNLAATPRDDVFSKTSPIAWPGNLATPKPTNGSAFRQPSPDPWASGFSSRRASHDAASTPRLVLEAASPADAPGDTLSKDALGIQEDTVWDAAGAVGTDERTLAAEPALVVSEPEDAEGVEEQATPVAAPDGSDVRVSVESAVQTREYQSSTPSNDNTDHEEERQDSPITSIDEEPRTLRPESSRKASGKVQELVVKFDGLARAASEEPETIPRARSRSPLNVGKREDFDISADFGDFESADDTEPPVPPEPVLAEPTWEDTGAVDTSEKRPTPLADSSFFGACPIAMFGPLNFAVDLSLVTKLFTALSEPVGDVNVDHEVPDHVISDSFTEISERKTWYRISRMGSSRRHNAGDDESYRRVTWPPSAVHHDTIKIVRRWMEEDSIAGRVALGGGISKTQKNMFGWDSTAEPVALDTVFGKKSSHARISSVQSLRTTNRSSAGSCDASQPSLSGPAHRPSGSAGSAVASFGWSSSMPASTGQSLATVTKHEPHTATAPRLIPDTFTPQRRTGSGSSVIPQPTTLTMGPVAQTHVSQVADIPDDFDDDEWGEMVSSPVVPSHPVATGPLAASISTASGPQKNASVNVTHSAGPAPSDPWGTVDLSVFESAPAEPAFHVQAPPADSKSMEYSAKGPTPGAKSGTAVVNPLGRTTTDESHKPPSPTRPPNALINDPQHQQDEAAQDILSNLPDLSYMLR